MANKLSAWQTITPDNVPSLDNLRDILLAAGYTGAATEDYVTEGADMYGQPSNQGATRIAPGVAEWLQQQGYSIGQQRNGNDYSSAVLDPAGNALATAGYHDKGVGPIKYIVPAMLGAMAGGAGLYALGGLGAGAGAGADVLAGGAGADSILGGTAIGNGAFLGDGVASGIPAWDAAAGIGAAGSTAPAAGGFGLGSWDAILGAAGSAAGGAGGAAASNPLVNALGSAAGTAGAGMNWADLAGNVLGTGAQIFGANQAANQLGQATGQANELQRYMYDTTRSDNMPALGARNSALAQMQSLLADPSTLTKDPGYQFGLNEGTKALNNGAAARGMTYSGAQGKALQRYGQDYAGTKLDQSFNRLAALAAGGQPGASTIAAGAQNYGNTVGNNITNQGNVNAMPYIVGGNALNNAITGLTAYGSRNGWWGKP